MREAVNGLNGLNGLGKHRLLIGERWVLIIRHPSLVIDHSSLIMLKYLDYLFLTRPVLMPPVWTILLLGHARSSRLSGENNLPGLAVLLVTFLVFFDFCTSLRLSETPSCPSRSSCKKKELPSAFLGFSFQYPALEDILQNGIKPSE